jgi:hypothetical protein
LALQADKARKALSRIPAKQPKRLVGYNLLAGFRERHRLKKSTIWLHAINGDPVRGKDKKEMRKELGFDRHDDEQLLAGTVQNRAMEVEVIIEDPPRHGMPLTYLDGLSQVEFKASSQAVRENVVVTRWEVVGTHSERLLGVPPTGKTVSFLGISWLKFEEERTPEGGWKTWATDEWTFWDLPSLMEQIGATP